MATSSFSTVSAGVASDGLLSLAGMCEDDIWLYVEVDRQGNVEAAVSKWPSEVRGLNVNSVRELTPELVLGIVQSLRN